MPRSGRGPGPGRPKAPSRRSSLRGSPRDAPLCDSAEGITQADDEPANHYPVPSRDRQLARLDDLIAQVTDSRLRAELQAAFADTRRHQRFGLVFEDHAPETTTLYGHPIKSGATVQRRTDPAGNDLYRVDSVDEESAACQPQGGGQTSRIPLRELLVVKRFG